MAVERTLSIIKPDAVAKNVIGQIYARFEKAGLKVVAARMAHLSRQDAEGFYAVHKGRPFFNDLVSYITSSPVVVLALEGSDAIVAARTTIGATKPSQAAAGTIRGDFALEIGRNLVHGSDSVENGQVEVANFFSDAELYSGWERSTDKWIAE